MWQALIGGVFGLVAVALSSWLVEGGEARRARRTIREELEILQKLGERFEDEAAELAERVRTDVRMYLDECDSTIEQFDKDRTRGFVIRPMMLVTAGVITLGVLNDPDMRHQAWWAIPVMTLMLYGFGLAIAQTYRDVRDRVRPAAASRSRRSSLT
jgi:cytochrome c-type biogenesis protein CcmH/NrfF